MGKLNYMCGILCSNSNTHNNVTTQSIINFQTQKIENTKVWLLDLEDTSGLNNSPAYKMSNEIDI